MNNSTIYFNILNSDSIKWVSPLSEDKYAEYRDQPFIDKLGITLEKTPLENFWPKLGPQWDALGRSNESNFLVEAKANLPEFISPSCQASDKSMVRIKDSLKLTQEYMGVSSSYNWTDKYYQYTNRLAHLYLTRVLNGLSAYLVLLILLAPRE